MGLTNIFGSASIGESKGFGWDTILKAISFLAGHPQRFLATGPVVSP